MRIIENPNPVPGTRIICEDCKCLFEYNRGDIQSYSNGVLGPGHRGYSWVNCPNCGKRIFL